MSRGGAWTVRVVIALVMLIGLGAVAVHELNQRDEDPIAELPPPSSHSGPGLDAPSDSPRPDQIERGRYLVAAGNCMTCHTSRGGAPYAGGRPVETPFGAIFSSNLTPDPDTGLGRWTPAYFWRALHNGRSKDGRLLYPAFPYPNFTRVSREDSDSIFAYLGTLKPVSRKNDPNTLRFPYDTQAALAMWRALFFKPQRHENDSAHDAEWNRGAYLVQGLGHCNACHSSRNAWGATAGPLDLSGGLIPVQNWYAPALNAPDEAEVADWSVEDIATLLKAGRNDKATVLGPMSEVVQGSTQYLDDGDLKAMATYLRALPQAAPAASLAPRKDSALESTMLARGNAVYKAQCARCHGDEGEGAPGAYPRLAGNRAVTMTSPANLVRIILAGGFAPATAANPRPYGMQPFATILSTDEIAAVASHIRTSWGNQASLVTPLDVNRLQTTGGR